MQLAGCFNGIKSSYMPKDQSKSYLKKMGGSFIKYKRNLTTYSYTFYEVDNSHDLTRMICLNPVRVRFRDGFIRIVQLVKYV